MKKTTWVFLWLALLFPGLAVAGNTLEKPSYTLTVTKKFTVNNGARLDVSNKYGKVIMHTWDKNVIQAVITITANGSNDDDARSLASKVNIQASQSGNTVSLTTKYDASASGSFWKQFFGGTGGSPKDYIHIDYEISLPRSLANMDISNNYGDVAGDGLTGNLNLAMNYGNFHLSGIGGKLQVNVNYCDGTLSDINGGVIHANYSDFKLDRVSNLEIHSNYSDYRIASGGSLNFNANYGGLVADNLDQFHSKSNYTDFKIGTLSGDSRMSLTYGNANIKTLGSGFAGLDIQATYGDVSVGIPQGMALRLDIHLIHGDIHTGSVALDQVEKSDEHGTSTLKGVSRGGGSGASLIKVSGTYSDVSLGQR